MNKSGSIIFNLILALAVIVLYLLHFSGAKGSHKVDSAVASAVVAAPKDIKASRIVYVNADTLMSKYLAIQDLKREAEARQTRLSADYQSKEQSLQHDYAELQQRASQGQLSSDQAKVEEGKMIKRKQELDGMEHQLAELQAEVQRKNLGIQEKMNKFLKEYNKNGTYQFILSYSVNGGNVLLGADSLDITKEIVSGLNEQYKAGKTENGKKK